MAGRKCGASTSTCDEEEEEEDGEEEEKACMEAKAVMPTVKEAGAMPTPPGSNRSTCDTNCGCEMKRYMIGRTNKAH